MRGWLRALGMHAKGATTWLFSGPGHQVDLLRPPLAAEVIMHITPDGLRQVFTSKVDPGQIPQVVLHLFAAAQDMAKQHGIEIKLEQKGQ